MDLSALIFVALAGAWVVYLVPKALSAQEEDEETRSVDSFSDRMRVLARREAGATGESELVVTGREKPPAVETPLVETPLVEPVETPAVEKAPVVEKEPAVEKEPVDEPAETLTPAQRQFRRAAAARAAKRRRRVLGLILLGVLGTVVAAGLGHIAWFYVAAPTALLVAWLVACRLMVRKEHAARAMQRDRRERRTAAEAAVEDEAATTDGPLTEDIPVVHVGAAEGEQGWDPVPITLPTYVEKAPAGRTVRTIDLDSTGVWSSGRNEADSQLAREAERSQQGESAEGSSERRRATGS